MADEGDADLHRQGAARGGLSLVAPPGTGPDTPPPRSHERPPPEPVRLPSALAAAPRPEVTFDRRELDALLRLYGRKVAASEWRDYAIDFGRDTATFSVFRRTSEMPLYRIVKDPRLARKQGAYSVVAAGGLVLRRGPELDRVLRVLEKGLSVVA